MSDDNEDEGDGNIKSFGDESTQKIFNGEPASESPVPDYLHGKAKQVMDELDCAESWEDLTRHDLTSVSGTSDDWYELDINEQYRIYFELDDGEVHGVQAEDHL